MSMQIGFLVMQIVQYCGILVLCILGNVMPMKCMVLHTEEMLEISETQDGLMFYYITQNDRIGEQKKNDTLYILGYNYFMVGFPLPLYIFEK